MEFPVQQTQTTDQATNPSIPPIRFLYSLGLLANQISEAASNFRPDPHVVALSALAVAAMFAWRGNMDVAREFAIGAFSLVSGAALTKGKQN